MNLKTKLKSPAGIAGLIGLALLITAAVVYGGFLLGSTVFNGDQTTKNKSAVTHTDKTMVANQENPDTKNTPNAASKHCNPCEANPSDMATSKGNNLCASANPCEPSNPCNPCAGGGNAELTPREVIAAEDFYHLSFLPEEVRKK